MKTLFININSSDKTNKDNVEVVKYDFLNDFYYALGEAIAQGRASSVNKSDLVLDYKKDTLTTRFTDILEEAELFKRRLWGKDLSEKCTICLPDEYLSWLRYNSNDVYRAIYETGFSTGNCEIVLDLQDFYEYSELKRSIWKYLKSRDIKEIIFSDTGITEESYIVHEIHENFPEVEYIQFDLWKGSQERLEQEKLAAEKAAKEEEERKRRELEEAKRKDEEERSRKKQETNVYSRPQNKSMIIPYPIFIRGTVLGKDTYAGVYNKASIDVEFRPLDESSEELKIVNNIPHIIGDRISDIKEIFYAVFNQSCIRSLKVVLHGISWDNRFAFDRDLYKACVEDAFYKIADKFNLDKEVKAKLFPIFYDFELGRTKVTDVLQYGIIQNHKYFRNIAVIDGVTITQVPPNDYFSILKVDRGIDFPEKWKKELGLSHRLTLKETVKLLHQHGFILSKVESPYKVPYPMIIAYTPDRFYELQFYYGSFGSELNTLTVFYVEDRLDMKVKDIYNDCCRQWNW